MLGKHYLFYQALLYQIILTVASPLPLMTNKNALESFPLYYRVYLFSFDESPAQGETFLASYANELKMCPYANVRTGYVLRQPVH